MSLPVPSSLASSSEGTALLCRPSYSNFTQQGWNVRFNAFVYKAPSSEVNASSHTDLLKLLGIDGNLNMTEQDLLNNRTTDLASLPVSGINNITAQVILRNTSIGNPITLEAADDFGEIDQFVVVPGLANMTGNGTQINRTVVAKIYGVNLPGPANSTTILVPDQGYSIVSDIDDVQRVTKVYDPTTGLKNSFVEPYMNYEDTPQVFAHWNETLPGVAFQYVALSYSVMSTLTYGRPATTLQPLWSLPGPTSSTCLATTLSDPSRCGLSIWPSPLCVSCGLNAVFRNS